MKTSTLRKITIVLYMLCVLCSAGTSAIDFAIGKIGMGIFYAAIAAVWGFCTYMATQEPV